jgi:hypothetical protein
MDIEFFEPLCIGDRVTTMGRTLHHVIPRETRVGVGAFTGYTTSYFNQYGQCIAKAWWPGPSLPRTRGREER